MSRRKEPTRRDPVVFDDNMRALNKLLNKSALKSSTRIFVLALLSLNRKLSSVELRTLTGLGKGSLENHLIKLERSGYVLTSRSKFIKNRGPPSQIVTITRKGLSDCKALVKNMTDLGL